MDLISQLERNGGWIDPEGIFTKGGANGGIEH
jgi:hypothetical protein